MDTQDAFDTSFQSEMEAADMWSGLDDRTPATEQTAYLVHNTVWLSASDVLSVYLSLTEAQVARDAAEKLTSKSAGWQIAPFRYEGALGDTVRLDVQFSGYDMPCTVSVATNGRIVAEDYESELPY